MALSVCDELEKRTIPVKGSKYVSESNVSLNPTYPGNPDSPNYVFFTYFRPQSKYYLCTWFPTPVWVLGTCVLTHVRRLSELSRPQPSNIEAQIIRAAPFRRPDLSVQEDSSLGTKMLCKAMIEKPPGGCRFIKKHRPAQIHGTD